MVPPSALYEESTRPVICIPRARPRFFVALCMHGEDSEGLIFLSLSNDYGRNLMCRGKLFVRACGGFFSQIL